MTTEHTWWKESVVYQIYPRSFKDSNGDGIGDIPGITEKLDYVDELGVDAVWLNPVYDSPLVDNGYDVRDYREILDDYGTMADWEALRDGLHERNIGLVMDLVVNHTSDEHEWFQHSRREEGNYADYYWWVDASPDEPPNNWGSFFGGPAWSYDDEREAWYLHLFDEKQPDLDWRNPDVREDVYEMMRWWLEKDIDGFRMDVINLLSKPEDLPDGNPAAGLVGEEHFIDGPRLHEYLREMHDRVLADYDVVTVGETPNVTVEEARQFHEDGLDMVFSFQHMQVDRGDEGPWDVRDWDLDDMRDVVSKWQTGLGTETWNSIFLGNHDQPRMVSRFGNDEEYRRESATMLATFVFTLQGTPFVYQGDEIGMTNPTFHSLDQFRDEATIQRARRALRRGQVASTEELRDKLNYWSRDNARTPMQWSDDENAGFTTGDPWITINEDYTRVNVEHERTDPGAVLRYYRRLIDRHAETPLLVYGEYEPILEAHPEILAYLRTSDGVRTGESSSRARRRDGGSERLLVVLNFFDGEPSFRLPGGVAYDDAELVIGNYETDATDDPRAFDLRPYEARVYRLS